MPPATPHATAGTTGSQFRPPRLLRNPHVQTLLASIGRKPDVARRAAGLLLASRSELLTCADGVILQAWINEPAPGAEPGRANGERPEPAEPTGPEIPTPPTIVIIHGWLGSAESSYVLSAAAELLAAGFRVARLNLRDHGGTEHLNEELFHSARTAEVVDAVWQLTAHGGGVLGFSLGGNFALRVARALGIPTLAVCPAIEPANTMRAIDSGWIAYRWYFLRKWRRALIAKQQAFPHRYDFRAAQSLNSVATLTDLFVREHTDFADTDAYLTRYTLTGPALAGTRATIVTAEDDPIIPWRDFGTLPATLEIVAAPWGGHCGFVEGRRDPSWIDRSAVRFFRDAFR
jgi:predicted alpha/beta-fold hydrolase